MGYLIIHRHSAWPKTLMQFGVGTLQGLGLQGTATAVSGSDLR